MEQSSDAPRGEGPGRLRTVDDALRVARDPGDHAHSTLIAAGAMLAADYGRLRAAALTLLDALDRDEGYDRGFNSRETEQAVAALVRVVRP